ncbi:hypothetical protein FACS1894133_6210 [Clostridia bacterium]|nr:hypothetical protein FACS1894133_6210 [Clostridia bacterium]
MNNNNDFPRILTLLRKEKGVSQREVAERVGVAQALLSHYERGQREPGLSFIVKIADYYDVSADYLLGRTATRKGTVLKVDDIADVRSSLDKGGNDVGSLTAVMTRKMSLNSIDILFDLLRIGDNGKLTDAVCDMIVLFVYKLLRLLHGGNADSVLTPSKLYGIGGNGAGKRVDASLARAEADALDAQATEITVTTESLERDYGNQAVSLLTLIRAAEATVQRRA